MRIHGKGTSFGSGGDRQDTQRSKRFRMAHRAGQKVRGTVAHWQEPGLAWVEIDGHRLLARIGEDAVLGQERWFLIVRLEPDIVLRALSGSPGGLDVLV